MANPSSILNVDHNRVRRQANSRLLSSTALVVHESSSGREALQKVVGINPDVVLLTGRLPDIDGFAMCRQLRENPRFGSLILLRDSPRAGEPEVNGDGGPDAWLPERCATGPFLSTVHTLLRMRKELSEARQRSEIAAQMLLQCYEESEGFAFQACHDLEEPVRALSALQMIERAPDRFSPEEKLFLEQALAGTQRLRRLFGQLLSYSQIPRDHQGAPRRVDLNLAARAAIFRLNAPIRDSGADIQLAGPLPIVSGNLARLQQVFECLLTNAMQYRRSGQPVVIRIGSQKPLANQPVISVADNGTGISSQYHQTVFQPFKRLHGREIPGSGMGLAICKRIVEAHNGRIWVESEPGDGATFFFSLTQAPADV